MSRGQSVDCDANRFVSRYSYAVPRLVSMSVDATNRTTDNGHQQQQLRDLVAKFTSNILIPRQDITVGDIISYGGQGAVYRAKVKGIAGDVAVKIYFKFNEKSLREAQLET